MLFGEHFKISNIFIDPLKLMDSIFFLPENIEPNLRSRAIVLGV
jgi:hypothetical protein